MKRNKKGQFVKGAQPWNRGLKGFGKEWYDTNRIHTLGARKKMRIAKLGKSPINKGVKKQTNTGRTHFKKGQIPHNYKGGITKTRAYKNFYNRQRECRKKNIIGSHTRIQWETLKKKYNYMCLCCKKCEPKIVLSEDHIVPISKNGTNFIENIQPLCMSCNSRKHIKSTNYLKIYGNCI